MSALSKYRSSAATAAVALGAVVAAVAGVSVPPPAVAEAQTVTYPTADGVDYHKLAMRMEARPGPDVLPNCTEDFGEGSGACGDGHASTSANPSLGRGEWQLAWDQCGNAPFAMPECHPGWLAIRVWAGDAWFHAYMTGRGQGELYFLRGNIPAWNARSPITGPPGPPWGPTGRIGGPLHIDVEDASKLDHIYDIDIDGHLLYSRTLRTYSISGYLEYGTSAGAPSGHYLDVTLEVPDTPSSPRCNAASFTGVGGCVATFTPDSSMPFAGAGGSGGLHWNQGRDVTLVELVAPSGSRIGGRLDGSRDRFKVQYGAVPEWDANTAIVTTDSGGRPGKRGGPLLIETQAVGDADRPGTRILTAKVRPRRHLASFEFAARGGSEAAGFECRLDGARFRPCESPKTFRGLGEGRHRFAVRAHGADQDSADRTPAKRRFRI